MRSLPCPICAAWSFPAFRCIRPANSQWTGRVILRDVRIPMLFLQGTRDALADIGLLEGAAKKLGPLATLLTTPDADPFVPCPVAQRQDEHAGDGGDT